MASDLCNPSSYAKVTKKLHEPDTPKSGCNPCNPFLAHPLIRVLSDVSLSLNMHQCSLSSVGKVPPRAHDARHDFRVTEVTEREREYWTCNFSCNFFVTSCNLLSAGLDDPAPDTRWHSHNHCRRAS